jgi:hypothetical protein
MAGRRHEANHGAHRSGVTGPTRARASCTTNDPDGELTTPTENQVRVSELRAEYHHGDAIGIGEPRPRLSWISVTDAPGWMQSAYEVEIDCEPTGRRDSDESLFVEWPGATLHSRERRQVRVRVWADFTDADGEFTSHIRIAPSSGRLRPPFSADVSTTSSRPVRSGTSRMSLKQQFRTHHTVRGRCWQSPPVRFKQDVVPLADQLRLQAP